MAAGLALQFAEFEGGLVRRVVVIGTTGSGKSTLAERLAAQTGLRVIELDALFWGKDWQPVPLDLFRHRVERETKGDGWIVVDGNPLKKLELFLDQGAHLPVIMKAGQFHKNTLK